METIYRLLSISAAIALIVLCVYERYAAAVVSMIVAMAFDDVAYRCESKRNRSRSQEDESCGTDQKGDVRKYREPWEI